MKYPATLTPDEEAGGFVVTFRDIPEAITQGDNLEDALDMASDALLVSMEFYFEDKRPVPLPSKPKKEDYLISLPASVSAKILLLNVMLEQNIKQADLARKLDVKPQEITRLIDLKHASKIDRIDDALKALGKEMEIVIS